MNDLTKRFTPVQITKLEKQGIHSLYDFITVIPRSIISIQVLENVFIETNSNDLFVWQGTLVSMESRRGKKPYLLLHFQGEKQKLSTYFFSTASYIIKSLIIGNRYQLLIKQKNGFWTAEKISQIKTPSLAFIQPVYEKRGELQSAFFLQLHTRLETRDYILNLRGLVPENYYIPQFLDLNEIHHPVSIEKYNQTIHQWIMFKVFLKMAVIRATSQTYKQEFARSGCLDSDFLNQMVSSLPFTLSHTQKQVVEDILIEVTETKI